MAHPILFGGATPPPAKYVIANSLRSRSTACTYLERILGTPDSNQKFTLSFWQKMGAKQLLADGAGYDVNPFIMAVGAQTSSATIWTRFSHGGWPEPGMSGFVRNNGSGWDLNMYPSFSWANHDSGAWAHVVLAVDSTAPDTADRCIVYQNGVVIPLASSVDMPLGQLFDFYSGNKFRLLRQPSTYFDSLYGAYSSDGTYADVHYVDGLTLSPGDFGKLNANGVWVPIRYSGSYGSQGFKLEFQDSGALGTDSSGNGNHFAPYNFTAADQMADTPSNNYATLDPSMPIRSSASRTLSDGNLTYAGSRINVVDAACPGYSTIAIPASGKYIAEFHCLSHSGIFSGIGTGTDPIGIAGQGGAGYTALWSSDPQLPWGAGDYLYVAMDGATRFVWIGKKVGSSISWSGGGDPVAGTSPTAVDGCIDTRFWAGAVAEGTSSSFSAQFDTSRFQVAPPTGFKALCTANLPAVAIPRPSDHFVVDAYTGTGASNARTLGMKPDLSWFKCRSQSAAHGLWDVVRGVSAELSSSSIDAESTVSDVVLSWNADGVTLGTDASGFANYAGRSFVGWHWKGGAAAVTNTDGSVTSSVSANPAAGFSVVTWTSNGGAATIGHGLGAAPKLIIAKPRSLAYSWPVYHSAVAATQALFLDGSGAASTRATWNDTAPTSTVFSIGNSDLWTNGSTNVAYCFAEIPGYSKFGGYTGNGSADGPFVYCGFRPRWLMLKNTGANANQWFLYDTARDRFNMPSEELYASVPDAETFRSPTLDITASGFKIRTSYAGFNASAETIVYAALAEHPFGGSNVSPSPAR